jgi:hypothetical protein
MMVKPHCIRDCISLFRNPTVVFVTGRSKRHDIYYYGSGGGGAEKCSALKVARQCLLVLLLKPGNMVKVWEVKKVSCWQ